MIDLKRNSKRELVEAKGIRTRSSSIYKPNQPEDFKISRSKFSDFLTCKKCFYLDRVKGLDAPGTPGWSLNETTDLLLKKEFDKCRTAQKPHRIFTKYGLCLLYTSDAADDTPCEEEEQYDSAHTLKRFYVAFEQFDICRILF